MSAATIELTPAEREELNNWHEQQDAKEEDHTFDLWLNEQLNKLWAAVRKLEADVQGPF